MNAQQLLNEILPILHSVKEDKEKLQKILDFLLAEIYEEPVEVEPEIPEKYRQLVHSVAESIDCGLVCFINPETQEVEEIPKSILEDQYELEEEEDDDDDENETFLHDEWDACITIEPRETSESFEIMENFTDQVSDKILKNKLLNALNNRKPFANFKNIVETSNYRAAWFAYKLHQLEIMVWEEIQDKLENPEN